MDWDDHLTRIRRYLRDPDGNIWDETVLLRLYNISQKNLNQEVEGLLQNVQNIRVPPLYQESYLYEWEWRHTNNTHGYIYQALKFFDQADYVHVAQFEAEHVAGAGAATSEAVYEFTQPWEAFMDMVDNPGSPPPVWIDSSFSELRAIYWDKDPIDAITKKALSSDDRTWRTRSGKPQDYYRKDLLDNEMVIYPLPSTVSWTDIEVTPVYEYSHTYDWEATDAYNPGSGNSITYEDSTNTRWHTFRWEERPQDSADTFEYSDASSDTWRDTVNADSEYGIAVFDSDESDNQDFGTVVSAEGQVDELSGIGTDVVDADDNLMVVVEVLPTDLVDYTDESDYPRFLQKYIEYGALEAAYSANTDGRIQSLEEYWRWRKELGYRILKQYRSGQRADRDYRLQTADVPPLRTRMRPRLPDTYPAQF